MTYGYKAAAAVLAFCLSANVPAHSAPFYRLQSVTTLKGKMPGWDYLSLGADGHRLFMGRRHDGVTVFDVQKNLEIGHIDRSEGANMATLVPEFDRGYTTNGDGSTTVFELSTLKTIDRIKLGDDADAAYYEPVSQQLAFMRGDSHAITFVDAKTAKVMGEIHTQSGSLEAGAADGSGRLFVAERDRNAILEVDVATEKVFAEWPTPGCEAPTGMAYDSKDHRLFAGCRGENPVVAVLNTETGQTVTTLPIGRGNDGVVYDPVSRRIFTSNGIDGNLVIYTQDSPDNYSLDQAVTTRPMARTMAYDPKSRTVYLVAAQGVADPAKKINTGPGPFYPNTYFDNTYALLTFSER